MNSINQITNYLPSTAYFCSLEETSKKEMIPKSVTIEPSVLSEDLKKLMNEGFAKDSIEKIGYDGQITPFCLVAYNGDIPAGIINYKFFWNTLHIGQLYIFPDYRKKGIGASLMMQALTQAKEKGCRHAFVETMDFQAADFYKKFGFIVEFTRFGFENGATMHFLRKNL